MTDEKKKEFTLRIAEANRTQTVVILYDMFLEYMEDAQASDNFGSLHKSIQNARAVLSELINSLHMEYEVARNIYMIYRYVERLLIQADVRQETIELKQCSRLMGQLREAYGEVSRQDDSPVLMQNAESVYAGMTYGKNNLMENAMHAQSRGIFA